MIIYISKYSDIPVGIIKLIQHLMVSSYKQRSDENLSKIVNLNMILKY